MAIIVVVMKSSGVEALLLPHPHIIADPDFQSPMFEHGYPEFFS
jgi:hypothetical protein